MRNKMKSNNDRVKKAATAATTTNEAAAESSSRSVDKEYDDNDNEGPRARGAMSKRSRLPEFTQHGVYCVERGINLFSDLGTSQHYLPRDEDEQHDFRFDHAVDETREQLWLVTTELPVAVCKTLQPNGELDITATNNILNLELGKLGIKAKLLHDTRVLARRQS